MSSDEDEDGDDGQVTWRVWSPESDGRHWHPAEGWNECDSLEEAASALLDDDEERREAARDDDYLVAWGSKRGYLAAAASPRDLPEPQEILAEDEERFVEGEFEERPTLLGADTESDDDWSGDEDEDEDEEDDG